MNLPVFGMLACGVVASAASVASANGTPIKVIVFSGQSNMTGEFGMDELDFMGHDLSLPQNDILSDYWLSGTTQNSWNPLDPHTEVTNTSYGSELAFMRLVQDGDPSNQYASLKLSRGGANLADRFAPHNNDIYPLIRDYAIDALDRLTQLGYEPEVAGFVWIHGHSDLFVQSHSEDYDINLDELVDQFRIDVNAPDMFVMVSQTHVNQNNSSSLVPVQRQSKIDYLSLEPNAVLIDVDDLVYRDFFVHFDGTSRHIIGQRMADAYLATLPPPCDADLNGDGLLDNGDLIAFVGLFLAGDPAADANGDGFIDNGDITSFVASYLAGC